MSSRVRRQGRAAWTTRQVDPPRQTIRRQGVAVHWPGGRVYVDDHDDCLAYLRGWEAFHVDGKGWSSIGYNQAACRHGYLIDGRGPGAASGANGNTPANQAFGSVLAILGVGETPNDALLDAIRASVDDQAPRTPLTTHDAVRRRFTGEGTQCPGPALTAWVEGRPIGDDDMPTPADFWNHPVAEYDDTTKHDERPARVLLAQAHNRAGDARTYAREAARQADRNRAALSRLAESLAPEVAAEVAQLLGDGVDLRLVIEAADDADAAT